MKSELICDPVQDQPTEDAESVTLLDILITLSKRRRFIFGLTVGVALLASAIVLILPSEYEATTLVLPPGQNASVGAALLGQLGGGSSALASVAGASLGIKNPGDLYVSLFRSRTLEDSLIQRFGLMSRYRTKKLSDTRAVFENRSEVSLGAKDGLIRITVTDRDPKLAAALANGYVDEFRKLSANLAITEASQRRAFFQQQLLEANQNLANSEQGLKYTEQSTGILQVDSQARSLIESAAVLRGQIVAKEVEVQSMRTYATEDNPQMVVAQEQLAALKSQLARLSGSDNNSSSDIIVPKGNIPEAGMEYARKLRDVKYYETISELIARQFEMAKLDEAREGAIIQVADVAIPPDRRSSPKRTISVLAAAFLGFIIACGWSIFAGAIERLKEDPAERQRLEALRDAFAKH